MSDTPPPRSSLNRTEVAVQSLGALGWGILLAALPLDLLLPSAIAWIPLLLYGEGRRFRRQGIRLLPLRTLLLVLALTTAFFAPLKYEDTHVVEGLSSPLTTLGELASSGTFHISPDKKDLPLRLPSVSPTYRQAMQAVGAQTDLVCTPARCGNGMSILQGGYILFIQVAPRNPEAAAVVR